MFNNIDDALNWLYTQKKLQKRENLSRITKCVELLGININYPIIHITGTNGKGSTANYIKNILKLENKYVGLFTSPFILFFNERIMINDRYISNAEIMHYVNKLYDFSNEYFNKFNDIIPFFELTLLMSLMYFEDRKIDIAVIECGLGGLLDSTNFLKTSLSIITNVGYDHLAQLGPTITDIARHKLGIAHDGNTLLTTVDDSFKEQFDEYAKLHNVKINYVKDNISDIKTEEKGVSFKYKNKYYKTPLDGIYQAYNASLAIEAAKFIDKEIPDILIQEGLNETFMPGRFEYIKDNIIIDGAHNISAIEALTKSIMDKFKDKKIKIVYSALFDKEYDKMIIHLSKIATKFYFTTLKDLRATDPILFSKYTNVDSICYNDYKECIDKAIEELKSDELLLITGSLHFISTVRSYLK